MDEQIKNRQKEIRKKILDGAYGKDAIETSLQYDKLSDRDIDVFLKTVKDFYTKRKKVDSEFLPIIDTFFQILLTIYVKARDKNPEIAEYFIISYLNDIPKTQGTSLFHKHFNLIDAGHAFKNIIKTKDQILLWEVAKKLTLNYNEFLNGLLGILVLLIKCSLDLKCNIKQLKEPYGSKIHQFKQLISNHDLPYDMLVKFANSKLRNSIAHGTIWLESEKAIVNYSDKNKHYSISLIDFLALNASALHFADTYLSSVATIVVILKGNREDKSNLPLELLQLLSTLIGKSNTT